MGHSVRTWALSHRPSCRVIIVVVCRIYFFMSPRMSWHRVTPVSREGGGWRVENDVAGEESGEHSCDHNLVLPPRGAKGGEEATRGQVGSRSN